MNAPQFCYVYSTQLPVRLITVISTAVRRREFSVRRLDTASVSAAISAIFEDEVTGRLLQVITFLAVITWTNQFSRAKIMGGNSASRSRVCWHLVRSAAVFCFSFSERDSLVVVAPMMFTTYQDGWSIRPSGLVGSVPESK